MMRRSIEISVVLGMLLFSSCASSDRLLQPSGRSAFVPDAEMQFNQYVTESRANIQEVLDTLRPASANRQYLGDYTNAQAAAMRSPFQIPEKDSDRCNDIAKGADKGFLLIHGLTDSPYLMKNIGDSLHEQFDCSLVRAVLLPGHGTVAGDSLQMKYQDWEKIVSYGVQSFANDEKISELYLIGFSTGTSLIIDYLKNHKTRADAAREDKIKGVVLLSAAVKAKSGSAWLSPVVSQVKAWLSTFQERDAARYESFSMNAAAQFYELTRDMMDAEYALDLPVLMAVSADDATIDARAAREFFCYPTTSRRRLLLWYRTIEPDEKDTISQEQTPELMCDNIIEVGPEEFDTKFKTLNLAHTALSVRPDDPHYGLNGKYRNCRTYDGGKTPHKFRHCLEDDERSVFAEKNVVKIKDELDVKFEYFRRGTFNPDYGKLVEKIFCFVSDDCPTSQLVSRP